MMPGVSGSKSPSSQPAAPLFVRDRYGSADSTSTLDEVEPKPIDDPGEVNPWVNGGNEKAAPKPDSKGPEIPPPDRGWKAWTVLAAASLIEGFLWGFPLCYGVFQDYYFNKDGPFEENKNLPTAGVLAMGCHYLGAPLMAILTEHFKPYRRLLICLGWPLCISGMIAASFAQSVLGLIMTQGFLYAFGVLILYLPLTSIVNEWFEARRGLAYGILTSSTGLAGAGLPFLASYLLNRYSHPTTLRIFALLLGGATLPALFLARPRFHHASTHVAAAPMAKIYGALLRTPLFHFYSLANLLHAFASFLPAVWLPQHASSLGLPPLVGALLLALLSFCQAAGQLVVGSLSDRLPLHALACASSLLAGICVFALWGPATSLPWLAGFAAAYGLVAAGFVVLWARMGAAFEPPPPSDLRDGDDGGRARSALPLATFGLFSFQKGLGGCLAGPFSGWLLRDTELVRVGTYGSGKYVGIIVFTGACMCGSAAVIAAWHALPKRWRDVGLARRGEVIGEK